MEITNNSSDKYAQLKETGQLPNFVQGVLNKYSSAIVRQDGRRQGVNVADVVIDADVFLDSVAKELPNSRREAILRELMFDLLPAKDLFGDDGNLKESSVGDDKGQISGEQAEALEGLPVALMVGKPVFDANSSARNAFIANDGPSNNLLLEVVKKDIGAKIADGEFYSPRNKLARLWLTFTPANLKFLLDTKLKEDDFDLFINRIRSGNIPACLISDAEITRVIDYVGFRKKATQNGTTPTDDPPPLPAFGRMVQRYRSEGKLNDVLDTLANEEPYSKDWIRSSGRELLTMVPVVSSDPDDLPLPLVDTTQK